MGRVRLTDGEEQVDQARAVSAAAATTTAPTTPAATTSAATTSAATTSAAKTFEWRGPVEPTRAPVEDGLIIDLTVDPPQLIVGDEVSHPLVDHPISRKRRVVTRVFDLAVAVPALILTAPLVAVLAVAVRATSPGPAFFASSRITRDGRIFTMWKLRTMRCDGTGSSAPSFADDSATLEIYRKSMKLVDDPRVTGLGRVLRRWSLDELPQFFNVVIGHMSIVGPRPLLFEEAERLGAVYPTVIRVKGGLTGLWQTSGRSDLTFAERIPLDVRYVNESSLIGDIKILWLTAWQYVNGRPGAY